MKVPVVHVIRVQNMLRLSPTTYFRKNSDITSQFILSLQLF